MRWLASVALVGGCYAPSPPEGAPCSADGACPRGLTCDVTLNQCFRPGTQVDGAIDAPPDAAIDAAVPVMFNDDFARPDSATIDNGWIEKFGPAFAITAGEVTRIATNPESYRDNLVYRPTAEDVRDVAVSLEFRVLQVPPRFPQIFVRAQSSSITTPDGYEGYLLYVDGSTTSTSAVLGRQQGTVFASTLSTLTLSTALAVGETYRLTLGAQGANPVELSASVEHRLNGTFVTIGSTIFTDAATERIKGAGSVGFSGDEVAAYVYDNFTRAPL